MTEPMSAYSGHCPRCGLLLRPLNDPLRLLRLDLDRPEDDPRRVVHADCAPRRTA